MSSGNKESNCLHDDVLIIPGADLPLSVLMTAASTLAAVVMTPLLTSKLVGSSIVVNAWDLVMSSLNVVLLPVFFGLLLNTKYPKTCQQVGKYTPFISVLLVSMICGTVSAANSAAGLGTFSLRLLLSICLLHSSGFLWGYVLAKVTRAGERRARTISIETGMQNSALACVLAQHFPNPHLCALPGSISATCHSVIGSLLAAYWRKRPPKD